MSKLILALDPLKGARLPPLLVFNPNSGKMIRRDWTLIGDDPWDPESYRYEVISATHQSFDYLVGELELKRVDLEKGDQLIPFGFTAFISKVIDSKVT